MTSVVSHEARLASRPSGFPKRTDWNFTQRETVQLGDGELLVKTLYLSLDPAMRGWMNEGKSYIKPVEIGEVMRAGGVGKVLESRNAVFKAGDYVVGMLGVQEYAVLGDKGLTKV